MIREWLNYRFTPASPEARASGHLYEAIAFEARGRRMRAAWQPHWTECQRIVTDFVNAHESARSLAIMGSGCLFEVPKDLLAERFPHLVLVDRVFPRSVRAWAKSKGRSSIRFLELDLTNPSLTGDELARRHGCDLALSANLLSQLSLAALSSRSAVATKPLGEDELDLIRRRIEEHHLACLGRMPGRVLLWTDVERLYRARGSADILEREDTVVTELRNPVAEWEWNIAPAPEHDRRVDIALKMRAVRI